MTTSPYDPVQVAFRSVIHDFRNKLQDDDLYREILKTTSIDDIYDATDKLQAQQAKVGRLRHLSKIEPYLERLRDYSGAIETLVQAKPDILALIWGPIKLLIQWTSILKQSFDAIINTTAEIGELLPEFKEVSQLFSNNVQIKDVLVLFFQDVLDFYLVALKFFNKPSKFSMSGTALVSYASLTSWLVKDGDTSSKHCGPNRKTASKWS